MAKADAPIQINSCIFKSYFPVHFTFALPICKSTHHLPKDAQIKSAELSTIPLQLPNYCLKFGASHDSFAFVSTFHFYDTPTSAEDAVIKKKE